MAWGALVSPNDQGLASYRAARGAEPALPVQKGPYQFSGTARLKAVGPGCS